MMTLLNALHGVALGVWVGGMLLAAAVATPAAFKALPPEAAGKFLGEFFPRYYLFGSVCGTITLATLLLLLINRHFLPSSLVREGAVALMLALTLYAGYGLHPKIRALKTVMHAAQSPDREKVEAQNRFVRLHRQSVQLNAVVLLTGLALLAWRSSSRG